MPDVLVIDDNPTQLSIREAVLRGAGFSVLAVNNAEQALDFLTHDDASQGLQVILTDHVLPGASGAAFVRALRRFKPNVPVFVISGMDEAEAEYSSLGVTYLHKPCAPEELIGKMREAMQRRD
jgi:CheY-like chemotaxis protein